MKSRAFYPPIFAAFPVLGVFSANLTLCAPHDLWRPLAVAVGASAAIWLVLGLALRNADRGAAAATVVVAALYLYSAAMHGLSGLDPSLAIAGWAVAGVALAWLAAAKWRWHSLLNLLASALLLTSIGGVALGYLRIARDVARLERGRFAPGPGMKSPPDVYYVILDGYARQDSLARVMGFDNGPFVRALEARGFYVAPKCHSNFVQTELSLASSLNLDFVQRLLPRQAESSSDRGPLDRLVDDSAVARQFKSYGYETIAITSGFPAFDFDVADLHLGNAHHLSLLEAALLQMTPFDLGEGGPGSLFDERRRILEAAFRNVENVGAARGPKPRFVFVHILAPHPPFVFGPNGETRPHHGPFGFWDGSDFMEHVGPPAEYRSGYVGQLQWENRQVLAMVDALRSRGGASPIIVLQGDHGSKLGLNQNDLAKTDVPEAFSNLMAFEVPPAVRARLYPTMTPVNSFRIILAALFGARLPRLPDESWYSPFDHPYAFTDVTRTLARADGAR